MSKREEIIRRADTLIREKGYNAFSFYDIAAQVGIKTASVHYHFPTKTDLGIAVVDWQTTQLQSQIDALKGRSPRENLDGFLSIYDRIQKEDKVCIVGSLAPDFNTLDSKLQQRLKGFSAALLAWVGQFLEAGKKEKVFIFVGSPRTRALMIITSMMAAVQICRLTDPVDYGHIKKNIINDLIQLES